jgi:3-hydroxyisobutyrate dehydrogenase-like beta-hydroxyacid dehydrogenase
VVAIARRLNSKISQYEKRPGEPIASAALPRTPSPKGRASRRRQVVQNENLAGMSTVALCEMDVIHGRHSDVEEHEGERRMSDDAAMNKPRVGWIGIGKMGLPICERLVAHGFDVTALARNDAGRERALRAGLRHEAAISGVVAGAPIVVSAISDDAALLDVVFRPAGLKETLTAGQTFVETSTVSPEASRRVAEAMAALGVDYVRSPVSGSTALAAQGGLTAVISGPAAAVARLDRFYGAFTRKTFVVGQAEEARYLKLVLNSLVGGMSALLAEALAMGRKGGLGAAEMMDVICQSAVASPLLQYKRDTIVKGAYEPAFTVSQIMKDLDIIAKVSRRDHCPMPLAAQIRQQYEAAFANGCGDLDFFVLAREAARIAGL